MTIQECYRELGGDFEQLEQRLPNVSLIKKFITKFLDDETFSDLCNAFQDGQREKAFRAVHTLKGVCANLSFDRLFDSATRLTEELRPQTSDISDIAVELMADVKRDYEITVAAIRKYLGEQ